MIMSARFFLVVVQYSIVSCHLRLRRSGDDRGRTEGLRLARAALSQLSYIPLPEALSGMGLGRVELPTSRLSGVRSNHLSYRPDGVRLVKIICGRKRTEEKTSNL